MTRENQLKDFIKPNVYKKSNNRILKLYRIVDKLNLTNEKLINENLQLEEKTKILNSSFDNLDDEINNLENDFKALPKPLIIDLKCNDFSIPVNSLLFLLLISLLKIFLTLNNDNNALKVLSQGNI